MLDYEDGGFEIRRQSSDKLGQGLKAAFGSPNDDYVVLEHSLKAIQPRCRFHRKSVNWRAYSVCRSQLRAGLEFEGGT